MGYGGGAVRVFALGVVIGCATLLSACGGGGSGELSSATASRIGSIYRMDYQFDAARRIKSYEMWDEATGRRVQWCSGDLHGSWECRDEVHDPHASTSATVDDQGRPVSYSHQWNGLWGESVEYSHNADGRLIGVRRNQANCCGDSITRTSTLEYDAAGQLAVIRLRVFSIRTPGNRGDFTYTVLSPSAVPTHLLMTKTGFSGAGDFTIQLVQDGTGRYTQRVINEVTASGERIASSLSYIIDSRGYVTSRVSEQYQYEPGLTPVIRTEDTRCLEWVTARYSALVANEGSCPSLTFYYSIVYPAERMPSAPLTLFPAYSASSALDLLCVIADECVDPKRMASGL